ncbi:MAG: DUF2586 family protein [Bacteroidales bacterium]
MALSKITIQRTDGNLGVPLTPQDNVTGLLFDTKQLPGTTKSGDVHLIYSVSDIEQIGVLPLKEGNEYESGLPHMHISEFFRLNPGCPLYVMFADCSVNWSAVESIQRAAQGTIRQLGVWTGLPIWTAGVSAYTLNLVADLNEKAELLASQNYPLSIVLQANAAGIEEGNVLTNLSKIPTCIGDQDRVTVLLGQGGSKLVKDIQMARTKHETVGFLGAFMSIVSKAKVSESVAWVGKYNLIGGVMDNVNLGFGDITVSDNEFNNLLPIRGLADAQLDQLDDKGYVFPIYYTGKNGVYISKDRTCGSNDYRMISRNRTIDKSRREVRRVLLDMLNSPIQINPSNGQMAAADIKVFKARVSTVLDQMQANGEISGYTVIINEKQNVLASDQVVIAYKIIPKGVATQILVQEGFALSTQNV